jgi:hypothetical protein
MNAAIREYISVARRSFRSYPSLTFLNSLLPAPPSRAAVCRSVSQIDSEPRRRSLSFSLAHTLTHGTLSPSRTKIHSLGCNQTMLRGDHGSRGGTLPHRPSKKPDPVLPTDSVCGLFDVLPREIRWPRGRVREAGRPMRRWLRNAAKKRRNG